MSWACHAHEKMGSPKPSPRGSVMWEVGWAKLEFQIPCFLLGRFTWIRDRTSVFFSVKLNLPLWVVVMIKWIYAGYLARRWTHRRCSVGTDLLPFLLQLQQGHVLYVDPERANCKGVCRAAAISRSKEEPESLGFSPRSVSYSLCGFMQVT